MVREQLIMIGRSERMFCKRENIGLLLKRSIVFWLEEKGRSQKYFGIANILRLEFEKMSMKILFAWEIMFPFSFFFLRE